MKFRAFFFWPHLILGVAVGFLILWFALTGFLLAYEPQVLAGSEGFLQRVTIPANGTKVSLDALAGKAKTDPQVSIVSLTVYADPFRSVQVEYARNQVAYLDPYTGNVLGQGANGLRAFFDEMTAMHRWMGTQGPARDVVKAIKGVVTCFFGLSILSGLYLWWPRQWTVPVFKVIGIPQTRFSGKQRDFNWHNAFGFWSAPWLLIIVTTGIIMIYPWANNLLFHAFGSEPPARPEAQGPRPSPSTEGNRRPGEERHGEHDEKLPRNHGEHHAAPLLSLDRYVAAAVQQDPQWRSINLRLPQGNRPNVMAAIEDPSSPNAYGRSMLTLDPSTAAVAKWEPYIDNSPGRKARLWVRALHTGEAGGLIGQTLAALACVGAMVLVATGYLLSWRRFFRKA